MPEKYVKRTNFWENLIPLNSSHLEVFLEIFWEFFIFSNSNLNFEFGPVWYWPKPEPDRTGLTGNRLNRTGSHRLGKPWSELDKTFSEKVTYAEQSVRRMKKVHLAHICTSSCSSYAISSFGNPNFLSRDSSSDCTFQFYGFVYAGWQVFYHLSQVYWLISWVWLGWWFWPWRWVKLILLE